MFKKSNNEKRINAELETKDLSNPEKVWEDSELTPSAAPGSSDGQSGMVGRVADAGDLADGNPTPYNLEVQAEMLAKTNEHLETKSPAKSGK